MNLYHEIELDQDALQYMRQRLANGHTLARYLLQRIERDTGKVVTILPNTIDKDDIRSLSDGILQEPPAHTHKQVLGDEGRIWTAVPVPTTDFALVSRLEAFLGAAPDHVCVFENNPAMPHDPWLKSSHVPFAYLDNEVYHIIDSTEGDGARILKTIRIAKSWVLAGALTSWTGDRFTGPKIPDEHVIRVWAECAREIIVDAFDGEGYLIWTTRRR